MNRFRHWLNFAKRWGFQQQWIIFRKNLNLYRWRILLFFTATTAFYSKNLVKEYFNGLRDGSQKIQITGVNNLVQSWIKKLVQRILRDKFVQQEAVAFGQQFIKQPQILQSIVQLLKESVKTQSFQDTSKDYGKKLVDRIFSDKQVEANAVQLVVRILQDQEVIQEVVNLLKVVFTNDQSGKTTGGLLAKGFSDQRVQQAIIEMLKRAVVQVIKDKETVQNSRRFVGGLVKSFFWRQQ